MNPRDLLKHLMTRSGDNPNSLAAKLRGATKQPQIFKFVTGVSAEPRRSTLRPVADFYGVELDAFYDGNVAEREYRRLFALSDQPTPTAPILASEKLPGSLTTPRAPIDLTNNPDYPAVRRVQFKLSAGASGFGVDYLGEDDPPIVFKRAWFVSNGYRPEALFAVRVANGSMEPGLYDGDTVVVNTGQTDPKDGKVFAVNYEGELVIKRLVRDAGQWWLCSDNPDQRHYPRKQAHAGAILLGEIVHKQSERI